MVQPNVHWLIVAVILVIFFGGDKIPNVMRELGESIRNLGKGPRTGSPSHPIPVTGPIETKRRAKERKSPEDA